MTSYKRYEAGSSTARTQPITMFKSLTDSGQGYRFIVGTFTKRIKLFNIIRTSTSAL